MNWQFERVAGPYGRTEGPVWNEDEILFTDIINNVIRGFDPRSWECTVRYSGTNGAIGLAIGPDNLLYVCEGESRRVVCYQPDGRRIPMATKFEGKQLNRPNDLTFDENGHLWFTDPSYGMDDKSKKLDHDSVYRIRPGSRKSIQRMTTDTRKPNGILVDSARRKAYVADTPLTHRNNSGEHAQLRAYSIDDRGQLTGYDVFHDFYPHRGIDGMCFDRDGNIIATAGSTDGGPGPKLYVFSPGGDLLNSHHVPSSAPTNCTFKGQERRFLYVTGLDGCLYRTDTHKATKSSGLSQEKTEVNNTG